MADIKVQVCLYAFDCLYQNGEVLVDRPLTQRREMLYNSLAEKEGELLFAEAKVSLPALGGAYKLAASCLHLILVGLDIWHGSQQRVLELLC